MPTLALKYRQTWNRGVFPLAHMRQEHYVTLFSKKRTDLVALKKKK